MKVGRIVAVVLGVAVIGFVAYRFVAPKEEAVQIDTRPSVMTVKPTNREIVIYTEQIGTVAPTQSVSVFPKMGGEVLTVNFNAGDHVNEGDVLATINSDALTSLKIQRDAARVSMNDAATALSRTQSLADTGAVSAQSLEQASSAATSARLNYEAAKSQYDLQSSYTSIKAPISGIVENKSIEEHNMISGSSPIAVISANEGMEVKFGATADIEKNLKPGDGIKISYGGKDYNGNITEISNVISATTGLYDTKASLEGSTDLQTGAKVKLTLLKERESDVLTVPLSSVLYSGNDAFVYVYNDGQAVKRDITTGIYDDEFIAVKEGLTLNDDVISTWSNELYNGAQVIISDGTGIKGESTGNTQEEASVSETKEN